MDWTKGTPEQQAAINALAEWLIEHEAEEQVEAYGRVVDRRALPGDDLVVADINRRIPKVLLDQLEMAFPASRLHEWFPWWYMGRPEKLTQFNLHQIKMGLSTGQTLN